MPVRQVCNFVYAHLVSISQFESEDDREKFDGSLYEPFDGAGEAEKQISLITQIGG